MSPGSSAHSPSAGQAERSSISVRRSISGKSALDVAACSLGSPAGTAGPSESTSPTLPTPKAEVEVVFFPLFDCEPDDDNPRAFLWRGQRIEVPLLPLHRLAGHAAEKAGSIDKGRQKPGNTTWLK